MLRSNFKTIKSFLVSRMVLDKVYGKRPRGRHYQERYENIWTTRPNDGRKEGVVKDGATVDTRIHATIQGEKMRRVAFSSSL